MELSHALHETCAHGEEEGGKGGKRKEREKSAVESEGQVKKKRSLP